MKKIITLSIPEPCHEDWAKMTATEKGRHCDVCTKEVVDFTLKTDEAIVKYVSKNKNACGRFNAKQLNRDLVLERKSTASLAPYAASLLLPLAMLNGQKAQAQGQAHISEKPLISLGIGSIPSTDKIQITTTGKVVDANGNPLANVEISVLERNLSVKTFSDGTYVITTLNDETLLFHISNYTEKEVKLGRKNSELNIQLEQANSIPIKHPQLLGKIQEVIMGDVMEEVEEIKEEKAQEITISGTVTDENNLPLTGVNIIAAGTSNGTQSDFDGNYTISVLPNTVLIFSYVGYVNQRMTTSNINNTIDLQMNYSGDILGGLVVVAYPLEQHKGPSIGHAKAESYPGSEERQVWKKELKEAHDNEIEFKRLKKAKKRKDKLKDSQ